MMRYLEHWFPKEVKEKQKLNQSEVVKEELLEIGLNHRCDVQ